MTSQNIDFVDIQETPLSLENIISKVWKKERRNKMKTQRKINERRIIFI
jgi:hypothetical protein